MLLGDLEFRIEMPARTAYVRKPGAKAAARKGGRRFAIVACSSLSLSLSIFLGKMRSGERRISNFKGDVKSCECFFFFEEKEKFDLL